MEQKLNSFKTFKDDGILVICWMIIAVFMMLLPLTWWVNAKEIPEEEIKEEVKQETIKESWERHPGELNSSWDAQEMPVLIETESHQRFIELCEKYNLPADVIWETENYYWLKEWTILCIAISETSWWKDWTWGRKWCWNYGNVGNTDNPNNRRCFANQWQWLAAIWQTLNNQYLQNNKTIACLNWAWECIESNASSKRYSTWKSGNWQRNMIGCFYSIYQTPIDPKTFNLHQR